MSNKLYMKTDEDELTKETEWIIERRKKKKKSKINSPVPMETESVPIITESNNGPKTHSQKPLRPPPIIVNQIEDFGTLNNIIKSNSKKGCLIKIMNKHSHNISTFDADDYKEVTKALNNNNIQWHSYENKHTRPIRVVAKNLHHTCKVEEIMLDLRDQGFNIINAFNKRNYFTKEPLDIFVLSFDSSEDINKIHSIEHILSTIVKIESVKLPKNLPQCNNCQGFNHTKNYCSKQARCAQCAGKHETKNCANPPESLPKCCNCGEQHRASYRGCVVAKELQKIRNKKQSLQQTATHLATTQYDSKRKEPANISNPASRKESATSNPVHKTNNSQNLKKTYSEAVKPTPVSQVNSTNVSYENPLMKILAKLDAIESFNKVLEARLCMLEENFFGSLNV